MRPPVERSQSLRVGQRSESPLRPKVSFNRAVHIKRISRRLADVVEDEDSPDYSDSRRSPMMSSNGYSTLPRRGTARNGVKKAGDPGGTPSDRLSRLIKHDPKAEDEQKKQETEKPKEKKKKSLSERVRGMFSPKRNTPVKKEETENDVKTRYTEYKARNSSSEATDNETENRYNIKRRGSAPETRASWFRSIDRLKKPDRYFGDSDRRAVDSSADSELEGMTRAPSLVYLHTAAVGDIPHRAVSPSRRLSRSVSVLAPWAPRLRPPRPPLTRTKATQTEPNQQQQTSRLLPKLVFTGPSIEATVGRSTLNRNSSQMRGRK